MPLGRISLRWRDGVPCGGEGFGELWHLVDIICAEAAVMARIAATDEIEAALCWGCFLLAPAAAVAAAGAAAGAGAAFFQRRFPPAAPAATAAAAIPTAAGAALCRRRVRLRRRGRRRPLQKRQGPRPYVVSTSSRRLWLD